MPTWSTARRSRRGGSAGRGEGGGQEPNVRCRHRRRERSIKRCPAAADHPYRGAMDEPGFLLFASDATLAAMAGVALLSVAVASAVAERRRLRRRRIDAVGFMPWTAVFFLTFFPGVVLLALAAKGWLAG